jgi:hypothetical protein
MKNYTATATPMQQCILNHCIRVQANSDYTEALTKQYADLLKDLNVSITQYKLTGAVNNDLLQAADSLNSLSLAVKRINVAIAGANLDTTLNHT